MSSPRKGWGGAATLAVDLSRGLQARGHEVVLFCKPESALHQELRGEFACEPVLYGIDFPPAAIWRSIGALRRHRTDVVLSLVRMDLRLTAPAAKLAGIPVVAHRAELEPFSRVPHRRLLLDRLPDHWVANSRANREIMLRSGAWLTEDDVSTIYNGINPEPYRSASAADLGLPAGAVAVGYVGRLVIEKGLPELAAAWRRLAPDHPDLHLVIAGEGNYEKELKRRLGDAPRVRWLGFRRDIPEILKALDLVVMPSWEEPFGLVATEAMAAGKPVLATCAGGLAEVVVDGETGCLVPPRDVVALAQAIVALASDATLRTRMGQAGIAHVERCFSSDGVVEEYERVLFRAVQKATRAR